MTLFALLPLLSAMPQNHQPIDRKALVSRHNVTLTAYDGQRPLQVGNGEFAFGMDITGLQSFAPFNTMSQWGWESGPPPGGQTEADFEGQTWDTHGRPVRYPMPDPKRSDLSWWLAANPHRINLGRLGLALRRKDGALANENDIKNAHQKLDLWSGIVTSRFELDGVPVTVKTACHPTRDSVAVKVDSPLIKQGRLAVFLEVPGDNPLFFANFVGDLDGAALLESLPSSGPGRADYRRKLHKDEYYIRLAWEGDAKIGEPQRIESPTLRVIKAEYGARGQWADVTDKVAPAVKDGRLTIRVDNQLAGADPAPGASKELRVTYSTGGGEQVTSGPENELLRIDAAPERRRRILQPGTSSDSLSVVASFTRKPIAAKMPNTQEVLEDSRQAWPKYWKTGGAIDLSGTKDARAKELERRIVLSQYLMKVNEAGSLPPQESGLVNNGWYGRFHLEMVWWHEAQWALWNRWPELDKSIGFYARLLEGAKKQAASQGYKGARWPKCIGPDGREWPHEIHALLVWQQPHPIFFAELDYRAHPTPATLKKWQPIVEATADFLASYAFYDEKTKRYVLGPPIHLVSENTDPRTTQNPAFELGYWRYGLRTAQEWRKRLKLAAKPEWSKVLQDLSPLPQQDGVYVTHEGIKDMWTKFAFEHPALTGTFGMLPGDGVDRAVMKRTLDKVSSTWNFNHTWGWDFPMLAMCAARMGEQGKAIDFLLHPAPGFQFDVRGLATGGPFPYFPSNGGLLYAVAMMAAGWDGAPKKMAPGFPSDWKVRYEGLAVAP